MEDDEEQSPVDNQFRDWLMGLGTAAAQVYLQDQQRQNSTGTAAVARPASSGVPSWAIYAGIAVSVLGLILLLRRS